VQKVDEWVGSYNKYFTFVFVVVYQHWGYSRFVANATTLVFEYIQNDDGQVHDTITLHKQT